jgi:predicted dehydrogenase
MSNGALVDIGIYTIYPMVVLFGKPKKIQASGIKLSTGVDGEGTVHFEYDDMLATVLYSKISDSALPTEIQGEEGTITLDRINIIKQVTLNSRKNKTSEILSVNDTNNEYYYEIAEFIDLIRNNQSESLINSHQNTLTTIEILDEIKRQIGNL